MALSGGYCQLEGKSTRHIQEFSLSPRSSQHRSWTQPVHPPTTSSRLLSHSFLHLSIHQALTWRLNRYWYVPRHASSAYRWLPLRLDGQTPVFWQIPSIISSVWVSAFLPLCFLHNLGASKKPGGWLLRTTITGGWRDGAGKRPSLSSFRGEFWVPCNAVSQRVSRGSEPHCSQW